MTDDAQYVAGWSIGLEGDNEVEAMTWDDIAVAGGEVDTAAWVALACQAGRSKPSHSTPKHSGCPVLEASLYSGARMKSESALRRPTGSGMLIGVRGLGFGDRSNPRARGRAEREHPAGGAHTQAQHVGDPSGAWESSTRLPWQHHCLKPTGQRAGAALIAGRSA
jgi:hypothetical protein